MRRANMPPIAMLSPVGRRNSDSSVRSPLDSRSSDQAKPSHRRRDPDAARMTAYSMPEPMATTQAPKTTGHISSRQSAKATEAPRSASMYWMPDHLCKSCYDCGASFTVFRRRHHCRLCGQIFCHNCSSQFVDGTLHGFPNQMIRICKFCSRYVTADAERKQQAATEVRRRASLDAASSPLLQSVPAIPPESTPVEKTSPLLFSPMSAVEAAAIPLPEDDAPIDRISDELEQEIRAGIPEEISAPTAALYSIESTESIDFPEDHQEPADGKSFRRPSLMRRRRSSLEFLNGQSTLTAGDLEPAQLVESESTESALEATLISRPSLELDSDSFRVKNDLHTQREIILDKYMKAAHDRIKEGIQRSVDRSIKHFASDGVEVKRLVSSLEDMAFIVTGHLLFSMKFRTPNGFNFDELVKVKSIATPMEANSSRQLTKDPYSFKWLAGCVCRKQLSHKQMARRIDNPRILLLACAISYDRSSDKGKMSSLDALIESEQSYMAILVRKISKLEPDIIFVERTVSRYAQEFLQQLGVAIVLNVKHETLERIGRYTGAMVLPSVDHVDQVNPEEAIGRCRSFYAQTVPIAPEDGPDTPAAPAPSAANGEGHITYQRSSSNAGRAKNETYLYLDGCDPLNGCTVLITGPSKKKLGVMKTLMRNVLSMTYRTLLEAHVLSGLDLSFIDWYRHSLADQLDRVTWCTTCTLRQYETVEGKLRYYQCSGSKRIGIAPYANEDISLGNFLAKEMEALSYRCSNPKCGFTMVDHVQTFSCTAGTVTVSFEELPDSTDASSANGSYVNVLSLLGNESGTAPPTSPEEEDEECPTIVYGKWCIECAKMVCPFAPLKKYAYKFSLARLLEILLSDSHPESVTLEGEVVPELTPTCPHNFMKSHVLFFNVGRIVARMDFAMRKPLRLFNTPSTVVIDGKRRRRAVAQCLLSNTGEESSLVAVAAASRTEMLMSLLDKLMELFSDKVGNVEEVVLSCQDQDEVATDVLIEIAFVKKLIDSECLSFSQRIAAIGGEPSANKQLAETDHVKRALYYAVCGWIEEMQKLRRLIRAKLAIEPDNSVAASPFSLSGFSFSTPTSMSPASSPRRSRPSSKEGYLEERDRSRASSSAQSFNGAPEDRNSLYAASSPGVSLQPKLAKSVSVQSAPAGSQKIDSKESGWRGMLWDIYRAVGKSTPGDDLDLPLPVELLEGHPSLSSRSNDCTFLVNEMVPITSVAYALASQSYDEQLEAWKISLQARSSTNGLSPTAEAKIESSNSSSSTEWTRSALSTSTHMHFKHTVVDTPRHIGLMFPSGSGSTGCWEFSTIAFFPLQFEALRELFYGNLPEYLFSISHVNNWAALGGKSGASFYRTLDDRFVVKHISSTEQQSFLEVLPSYFDYMSKVFHDEAASVISKTFGMYQTTITRKDTGQRTTHHIVVMENAFYGQTITKTFDLKGSSRNRYVKPDADGKPRAVELDGNFVEMTEGHPMGVIAEDHELLLSAIENDSAFLTSINIVDFSLVLGLGGNTPDLPNVYTKMTVGIIDYMRQFDLMKRVESVSKSVAMIAGQSSPTIIEPALYSKRFSDAVRRYFMPVTPIDSDRNDPYIASR